METYNAWIRRGEVNVCIWRGTFEECQELAELFVAAGDTNQAEVLPDGERPRDRTNGGSVFGDDAA